MERHETRKRSLVKSICYRILSISVDTTAAYLFTRELPLSLAIVFVVNGYSTLLYYGHERIWGMIRWGYPEKK